MSSSTSILELSLLTTITTCTHRYMRRNSLMNLKNMKKTSKKVKDQSAVSHLHINVHINKNKVELDLLLHRKLRKSLAEKEAELQALHRRSWHRAETNGSIKRKTQQCKICSHSHSRNERKHNHVAKTSGKSSKIKSQNGSQSKND